MALAARRPLGTLPASQALVGRIVETADREALYASPAHPYTEALLSAIPLVDPAEERERRRIILRGDVPSPLNTPTGCNFASRCPKAFDDCEAVDPPLFDAGEGHRAACLLVDSARVDP